MKTKLLNSQKSLIHSSSQGQIQFRRALYRSHSLSRSSSYKWPILDVSEEVNIQLLIEKAYSAFSELEPVLRAAITEEVRAKLQQESFLPFPWGDSKRTTKMRWHSTSVMSIVKQWDIGIITHTFYSGKNQLYLQRSHFWTLLVKVRSKNPQGVIRVTSQGGNLSLWSKIKDIPHVLQGKGQVESDCPRSICL